MADENPLAGPTPDMQDMPMNAGPQLPPTVPAQATPPAPNVHSILGKAVRHIASSLEGQSISYKPDPTTGEAQEVVGQRRPGGFFRDLLLGAALGGSAGASAPLGSGALGGFAAGVTAQNQNQQAQQQRQKQQALEQAQRLKNLADAKAQKLKEEDLAAATIAHNNISSLETDLHSERYNPKQLDSHNSSADIVKQEILKNGGALAQVAGPDGEDMNGKKGNGTDLMKMFNQNPTQVMQAPDGFHRVHLSNIDYSGLTYKPGAGYVDDKGKPVDLADRTTHYLLDLPETAWNKSLTLSNGTINDVAGYNITDGSNKTSPVSFGSMFGLRLKNIQQLNQARAELYAPPRDENEAMSFKAFADTTNADPNATPEDKQRAAIKGKLAASFLQSKEDSQKDKPLTPEQDKLRTRDLTKKLRDGTINSDEREDLVTRQQEAKLNGVDSGIASQVGKPPVPAQFPKGESDPAFKVADQVWGQKVTKLQTAKNTAGVQIRMQAFEDVPYNVINTKDNSMGVMTRGELAAANKQNPGQYLLATQDGLKVKGKQAAIGDIEYNFDNVEKTIGALDNLDLGTRAKLAIALRSPDPHSALATLMTSEAKAFSDPKLQDAMIGLTSLSENVMLLRSVQGIGGAGSDLMRHALMDLVPSAASPSKGYALKQMKVLRGTLNRLKTGVPSTGTQPQTAAGDGSQQGGQAPPQGATAAVKNKDGQVTGYVVNGKYVANQ